MRLVFEIYAYFFFAIFMPSAQKRAHKHLPPQKIYIYINLWENRSVVFIPALQREQTSSSSLLAISTLAAPSYSLARPPNFKAVASERN